MLHSPCIHSLTLRQDATLAIEFGGLVLEEDEDEPTGGNAIVIPKLKDGVKIGERKAKKLKASQDPFDKLVDCARSEETPQTIARDMMLYTQMDRLIEKSRKEVALQAEEEEWLEQKVQAGCNRKSLRRLVLQNREARRKENAEVDAEHAREIAVKIEKAALLATYRLQLRELDKRKTSGNLVIQSQSKTKKRGLSDYQESESMSTLPHFSRI